MQAEIPGLGEVIASDVKHISAWVRENNSRESIAYRFSKDRQPKGDLDCRVGVKKSTIQEQPDGSTTEQKEYLWGYGSGVVAAITADYGDVVLAEYTQPFHENDVTYFRPLYQRTVVALNQYPTRITADAAFDAWYVYEGAARHHGIGAIPLNQHSHSSCGRAADGTPRCEKGLLMQPTYQALYTQRTSCERINSQAQALGIERPKVRNGHSVHHLNTLMYVVINVRALQRAKSINRRLLQRE